MGKLIKGENILAFDCSSRTCSVALINGGSVLDEFSVQSVSNHSQVLLKSVIELMENNSMSIKDIGYIALTAGPGSFTGLKIGVSTAKGLAFRYGQQCLALSTLETLAFSSYSDEGLIVSSLDARHGVVFGALFDRKDGKTVRISNDQRKDAKDIYSEVISRYPDENIILCGDGSHYFVDLFSSDGRKFNIGPESVTGTGFCSVISSGKYNLVDSEKLVPEYLRPSQAEREM